MIFDTLDNPDFAEQRKELVKSIEKRGIRDKKVLDAIGNVPRHIFMDKYFVSKSYQDHAFPINCGQSISQPFTVGFQTQLLSVSTGDKILEIGTGSGYQTAILLEMGAQVYTIERQYELYLQAKNLFEGNKFNLKMFFTDGYEGLPEYSPFDSILLTAAAPKVPEKLIDQLKRGGRIVAPIGGKQGQRMMLVEKLDDGSCKYTDYGAFMFVPMVSGTKK